MTGRLGRTKAFSANREGEERFRRLSLADCWPALGATVPAPQQLQRPVRQPVQHGAMGIRTRRDGIEGPLDLVLVEAEFGESQLRAGGVGSGLMHRQSLRDTLERARKLCLEAEVRLESPSDLLEDGVSRWTWISSRLWEGYSDLEDLGARLPQEAKPKPSPRQITPQELGKVINEALTAAAAAIQAEDARMAALQGQAVSGQPAPTRLSDNQAEQTRALLRALWLGTEIAKTLAKSP